MTGLSVIQDGDGDSGENCATCRFYREGETHQLDLLSGGDAAGYCRRYPPVFLSSVHTACVEKGVHESEHDPKSLPYKTDFKRGEPDNRMGVAFNESEFCGCWGFPTVLDDSWCGEWQPKREFNSLPT
jgi:hypothetical protein